MRNPLRLFVITLLLVTLPAIARAGMLAGIEGMSSTVMQSGQSSFSGIGLRLRLHSDQFAKGFELLPTAEYWRNSSTVEPFGIKSTRKDATLALMARYAFETGGWHPYVGAGLGMHFLSTEVDAPSLGLENASHSILKGGLSGLAGLSFGLTAHLTNFIEVEYHHLSDHEQLKINWGLSYSP